MNLERTIEIASYCDECGADVAASEDITIKSSDIREALGYDAGQLQNVLDAMNHWDPVNTINLRSYNQCYPILKNILEKLIEN